MPKVFSLGLRLQNSGCAEGAVAAKVIGRFGPLRREQEEQSLGASPIKYFFVTMGVR